MRMQVEIEDLEGSRLYSDSDDTNRFSFVNKL